MPHLELVTTLEGHQDRVWSAAWSPHGDILATCGGDKAVFLWVKSLSGWTKKAVLDDAHNRTVRKCAWSPDGKYLACASFDGTASIWENINGDFESVATLEGHENEMKSVSWDSSGSLLATCSRDKSVWIWEMEQDNEFECIAVLAGHSQDVKSVKWHPNRELLVSCSYDDSIKVWNTDEEDWGCAVTLTGHTSTVWEIAFDKTGGRIASVSDDNTLRIWGLSQNASSNSWHWKLLTTLSGYHKRCIYGVDWSHINGMIATGASDDAVRIFKEDPKNTFSLISTQEKAHSADINCVSWNPKYNILATCGDDSLVKLWEWNE